MNSSVFDLFYKITKRDLKTFFNDFYSFTSTRLREIDNFYLSNGGVSKETLDAFDSLNKRSESISSSIINFKEQLSTSTCEMWELIDMFEDVKGKLQTIQNYKKWYRSESDISYSGKQQKEIILSQFQSLETVAKQTGLADNQNSWTDIALRNRISEENYTEEGGVVLKVNLVQSSQNFEINNIVGSPTGENKYGKDIDKSFSFKGSNIKTTKNRACLEQALSILVSLVKGDNQFFPNDGVDRNLLTSNDNSFSYPSIFRQIFQTVSKDKRFKEISINSFTKEGDNIFMDIKTKTVYNEDFNSQILLK